MKYTVFPEKNVFALHSTTIKVEMALLSSRSLKTKRVYQENQHILRNTLGFERERIKSKYILILLSEEGTASDHLERSISSPGQQSQNMPLPIKISPRELTRKQYI